MEISEAQKFVFASHLIYGKHNYENNLEVVHLSNDKGKYFDCMKGFENYKGTTNWTSKLDKETDFFQEEFNLRSCDQDSKVKQSQPNNSHIYIQN